MRKALTITILALLVAGGLTMLVAYQETWSGSADGECAVDPTIYPFQPWIGDLTYDHYPYQDNFDGYWGGNVLNVLYGVNIGEITQGSYTFYQLSGASWDYLGDDPHGTWNCLFYPAGDTCDGDWTDSDTFCTDGDLWGTEQ